jgi:APA family basic amino acid/polyamine antiporter
MSTASAPPAEPVPVAEQEPRGTLTPGPATAMIVGSIIGIGIGGTRISVEAEGRKTR